MKGMNGALRRVKMIALLLLAAASVLSLAACGSSAGTASGGQPGGAAREDTSAAADDLPDISGGNDAGTDKALVIYFSRTGEQYTVGVIEKGNTAIVAEMIADRTGADIFEVLPEEDYYPYTYSELTEVAMKEQDEGARPAYQGGLPDLSLYDTIFIGAPGWWGDWPMIMYTVFESADFSGKKLVPFSTHEGSGLSGFDRKLSSACPGSDVMDGLAVRGNDAQSDQDKVRGAVNDWLSELGF